MTPITSMCSSSSSFSSLSSSSSSSSSSLYDAKARKDINDELFLQSHMSSFLDDQLRQNKKTKKPMKLQDLPPLLVIHLANPGTVESVSLTHLLKLSPLPYSVISNIILPFLESTYLPVTLQLDSFLTKRQYEDYKQQFFFYDVIYYDDTHTCYDFGSWRILQYYPELFPSEYFDLLGLRSFPFPKDQVSVVMDTVHGWKYLRFHSTDVEDRIICYMQDNNLGLLLFDP